jgi:hypothetical protein
MFKGWSTKVAAIGASVVLTMKIFSEPPRGRLRTGHVVERVVDDISRDGYDPREIVGNRIVLTLPIDRDAVPRRLGSHVQLN